MRPFDDIGLLRNRRGEVPLKAEVSYRIILAKIIERANRPFSTPSFVATKQKLPIAIFLFSFLIPTGYLSIRSSSTMSTPSLGLCTILSESKRIIKAHSRHFLALSVLFLLPSSFAITVYPTLHKLLPKLTTAHHPETLRSYFYSYDPSTSTFDQQSLLLTLLYLLFVFVLSLCAVGSITYSVFHGFYGRPVKFISAIKSILTSFLPLLATTILCQIIVSLIVVVFAVVLLLVVKVVRLAGFEFEYSSPFFVGLVLFLLLVFLLVLVYLQVNWTLVSVVVVVESSWGLRTLKRSKSLIQGYRWVYLSLSSFFSFFAGILIWSSSDLTTRFCAITDGWSWALVLQIVITSAFLTLLFLYNVAANTVLYLYCKAIHGELAMEIAEEFAKYYVSLPYDDAKVPHLVSVVNYT